MKKKSAVIIGQTVEQTSAIAERVLKMGYRTYEPNIGFGISASGWRATPNLRKRPIVMFEDKIAECDWLIVSLDCVLSDECDVLGVTFAIRQLFPALPISVVTVSADYHYVQWFSEYLSRVGIQPCLTLDRLISRPDTTFDAYMQKRFGDKKAEAVNACWEIAERIRRQHLATNIAMV